LLLEQCSLAGTILDQVKWNNSIVLSNAAGSTVCDLNIQSAAISSCVFDPEVLEDCHPVTADVVVALLDAVLMSPHAAALPMRVYCRGEYCCCVTKGAPVM